MIKKLIKKFLIYILLFVLGILGTVYAVPNYEKVIDGTYQYKLVEKWDKSFKSNLEDIFYPSKDWWKIWRVLSQIWFAIFVVMFIWAWVQFLLNSDNESELKKAKLNLVYILLWWFFFFGSVFIVSRLLFLPWINTTSDLVWNIQNNLFFVILTFLKVAAFFLAIIMIMFYWFKVIAANEKEEKIAEWRRWVLNVILALIFIKIIDYVYYLALQQDFMKQMWEFLLVIIKWLLYILWVLLILVMMYWAYLLLFSRWDEEAWKKFKNVVLTIFLVVVVIVLFVLIIYTLISNLASD